MVAPIEQSSLQSRLDGLENRYDGLRDKSRQKRSDLDRALATSRVFGEDEGALLRWLTDMERKLARPDPISIHPEIVTRQLASQTVHEKQTTHSNCQSLFNLTAIHLLTSFFLLYI